MVDTSPYRSFVTARAGGACEYCRLVEAGCGVTFHIEHIVPICRQGCTTLSNLALSCPGCNLAKAGRVTAQLFGGAESPLFNPRDYDPARLGWHLHFTLDRTSGVIAGRSAIGEVTVTTLDMNSSRRLFARKLQLKAGLIS
ncbi:HNH endonuclease [Roseiconus nitratireducens]|uniref:HNH endonuclease n=1 Tax=Roseiconus nitratireducens TaxID=2605748 RepID=A0A5M6CVD4_9BACT|nr:HNH endonuclease [Roseiconus nitratireducens]